MHKSNGRIPAVSARKERATVEKSCYFFIINLKWRVKLPLTGGTIKISSRGEGSNPLLDETVDKYTVVLFLPALSDNAVMEFYLSPLQFLKQGVLSQNQDRYLYILSLTISPANTPRHVHQ